jgi:nitrogen fixation protein FixH
MSTQTSERQFTGRHMLAIMLAFFGVIIAVNLLMATMANRSWTGLVVKNSYVASQQFNRKREEGRAQDALGWRGTLEIGNGQVAYGLVDAAGRAVPLGAVTAIFRRPAYEAEDQTLVLAEAGEGRHAVTQPIRDGIWIVEIDAEVGLERPYRDVRRIVVSGGVLK